VRKGGTIEAIEAGINNRARQAHLRSGARVPGHRAG